MSPPNRDTCLFGPPNQPYMSRQDRTVAARRCCVADGAAVAGAACDSELGVTLGSSLVLPLAPQRSHVWSPQFWSQGGEQDRAWGPVMVVGAFQTCPFHFPLRGWEGTCLLQGGLHQCGGCLGRCHPPDGLADLSPWASTRSQPPAPRPLAACSPFCLPAGSCPCLSPARTSPASHLPACSPP